MILIEAQSHVHVAHVSSPECVCIGNSLYEAFQCRCLVFTQQMKGPHVIIRSEAFLWNINSLAHGVYMKAISTLILNQECMHEVINYTT